MRKLATAIVLIVTLAVGWQSRAWFGPTPEPVVQTDTTYVDRTITKRDTVTVTRPVERIVYRRETDTVFIRVSAPKSLVRPNLIRANPLKIEGDEATLTYWNPRQSRWQQDVYALDRSRFELWPELRAEYVAYGLHAAAALHLRYGDVTGYVGYGFAETERRLIFGVSYRPFTIDW